MHAPGSGLLYRGTIFTVLARVAYCDGATPPPEPQKNKNKLYTKKVPYLWLVMIGRFAIQEKSPPPSLRGF
jgi:hypothetical protein